ncbi:MAG: ferritin-like domain-containing protein [Pseudomonadota bacterium]
MNLRHQALDALLEANPSAKVDAARALLASVQAMPDHGWLTPAVCAEDIVLTADQLSRLPGRPERPHLVPSTKVPHRSPFTLEGRAALLHAICHIEFNAINLALDAVWRFGGMPAHFYLDWVKVAGEEALHFSLLREHLLTLGHDYGDFDAHDGLWTMCAKTSDDILARMALVPRTLEARGLDATPLIQSKLTRAGDLRSVEILDIILRDEIGHVRIGNHWFHHLCTQRGVDAMVIYPQLVEQYEAPLLKPPYNEAARRAAGFTEAEMAFLLGVG